jgi:hypothetical protein
MIVAIVVVLQRFMDLAAMCLIASAVSRAVFCIDSFLRWIADCFTLALTKDCAINSEPLEIVESEPLQPSKTNPTLTPVALLVRTFEWLDRLAEI